MLILEHFMHLCDLNRWSFLTSATVNKLAYGLPSLI